MIAKLKPRLTRLWQSKIWDTMIMGLVATVALVYIIRVWDSTRPISMTILLALWLFACTYWSKILWDYHHND
jgi:hypothetical protein